MQLSSNQRKAVKHKDGAMLVLAGPGSGKTTVITLRLQELIKSHRISPEHILVITFTKAAASEMKNRFDSLCPDCLGVSFGTFHAIFFKILRHAYSFDTDNILSDKDRIDIISAIVKKRSLEAQDEKELVADISREISRIKNSTIELENYYPSCCGADDFRAVYKAYNRELTLRNRLDFDDMLSMTYELLSERPDILAFWQQRYRYILVDEFQDINVLQYRIVKLLASPNNNLFVVGDDDQSIYRFRGSDPGIMLSFPKDYRDCEIVALDENYRCPRDIVEASTKLIGHNRERYRKTLVSAARERGTVNIMNFDTLADQNTFVTESCRRLLRSGVHPGQIAVLYRNNSQPRSLLRRLNTYGIPFSVGDCVPDIYEHFIGRNVLSYLAAADNDFSRSVYLEIINRPNRKLPREVFMTDPVDIRDIRRLLKNSTELTNRFEKFISDIAFMGRLDPYASIEYLRKRVGYDNYLKDYAEYKGLDYEELMSILCELQEDSKDYNSYADWCTHIGEVRSSLTGSTRRSVSDGIHFLTFHSAKGLEFEYVFIIDAVDGLTPSKRADLPETVEEERRMFYVAMTRAKKELYILSETERLGRKAKPSRFIAEIQA